MKRLKLLQALTIWSRLTIAVSAAIFAVHHTGWNSAAWWIAAAVWAVNFAVTYAESRLPDQ